jgi:thiosulfate/3-mercaptopyruvate sulfurtransferase
MSSTIISVLDLCALETMPIILDCRYQLGAPEAGRAAYEAGHIPGAIFVSVDDELAGVLSGRNGRHPLPAETDWLETLSRWGVSPEVQVVVYDDAGGAFAARAWWLLRWVGHPRVAVLDGGFGAWKDADLPIDTAPIAGDPTNLPLDHAHAMPVVSAAEIRQNLQSRTALVVDARAPDRFRGENETIDPVGGHIPGAVNRFFKNNLNADGRFKSADTLRAEWSAVLDGRQADTLICQCGSGVTACHNLLALEIAGFSGARLYPGSWSEWCSDPDNPVAVG